MGLCSGIFRIFRYSKGMDSLQDLLARRRPDEPPEIQIVKNFVRQKFGEPVGVRVTEREIIVTVGSGSLASAVRSHTVELLRQCGAPTKRLVLRIGRAS